MLLLRRVLVLLQLLLEVLLVLLGLRLLLLLLLLLLLRLLLLRLRLLWLLWLMLLLFRLLRQRRLRRLLHLLLLRRLLRRLLRWLLGLLGLLLVLLLLGRLRDGGLSDPCMLLHGSLLLQGQLLHVDLLELKLLLLLLPHEEELLLLGCALCCCSGAAAAAWRGLRRGPRGAAAPRTRLRGAARRGGRRSHCHSRQCGCLRSQLRQASSGLLVLQLCPDAALHGGVPRPQRGREVVVEPVPGVCALVLPHLGDVGLQGDVKNSGAVLGRQRRGGGRRNARLGEDAALVRRGAPLPPPLAAPEALVGLHLLLQVRHGPIVPRAVLIGHDVNALLPLPAQRARGRRRGRAPASRPNPAALVLVHRLQLKATPVILLLRHSSGAGTSTRWQTRASAR